LKTFDRNEDNLKGGTYFYFLKKGRTVLRVLPPYSERGVWFEQVNEYNFNFPDRSFKSLNCPVRGEEDPVADFCNELMQSEDEKMLERAKSIRPRAKFLFNVVVLSDPNGNTADGGVKVLKAGTIVKRALLDADCDVQGGYGDITNLKTGFNITIKREGEGLNTVYTATCFRERTDIREQLNAQGIDLDQWELVELDQQAPAASVEELEVTLQAWKEAWELVPASEVTEEAVAPEAPVETATTEPAEDVTMSVPTQIQNPVELPEIPPMPEA
jgi:hypothetical protein